LDGAVCYSVCVEWSKTIRTTLNIFMMNWVIFYPSELGQWPVVKKFWPVDGGRFWLASAETFPLIRRISCLALFYKYYPSFLFFIIHTPFLLTSPLCWVVIQSSLWLWKREFHLHPKMKICFTSFFYSYREISTAYPNQFHSITIVCNFFI
jgi:hypothetical protein